MSDATQQSSGSAGAIPPSEAVKLAELVDYGSGAIVSRTLTKGAAGTLTIFAFDAGEELSEHSAPFDAYVTVLDGCGEIIIAGETVATATGQTVLMPANVPHAVRAVERFKMLLVMIKNESAS